MNLAQRMKERLVRTLRGDLATLMVGYQQEGVVPWSIVPPAGINYQTHKFSIIDAIEAASGLCRTDYSQQREWLVASEVARALLVTMPMMVLAYDGQLFARERGLTKLGTIGQRSILFIRDPKLRDSLVLFNEAKRCARISISTNQAR
jgi:hypothetical protein